MNYSNLFGMVEEESDKKYTKKVDIPQYLPKNEKPSIYSLCDTKKYEELMSEIERELSAHRITSEQATFLKLAASRHIVFNYSKIADYYAHSDANMQKLMEKSALVIIDVNDAIANGYVKLSKNIEKIMRETGRQAGETYD